MIVHVFNDRVFFSQSLSSKVGGMYPIYIDDKIVANIIADDNNWTIKLSPGYSSKELYYERPRLEPYKIYVITSKYSGENFYLITTPRFNANLQAYDILNQVTIGSDVNCDICYPLTFSNKEFLRISSNNSKWTIETNSNNFFISGKRAKSGQEILNGDYIFFFGLKLIFVSSKIIIDVAQNDIAKYRVSRLHLSEPEKKQPIIKASEKPNVKEDMPLYSKEDYYFKSPRFNYLIEPVTVDIDAPPAPIKNDALPAILTIGPQLTMAGASVLSMMGMIMSFSSGSRNEFAIGISIGTMSITVIGTLLWPLITRKYNKRRIRKKEEKRQKKYEK